MRSSTHIVCMDASTRACSYAYLCAHTHACLVLMRACAMHISHANALACTHLSATLV